MGSGLVEDYLQMFSIALLELLLQKTAAMLILAQRVDLIAGHRLQVVVHEAVSIF